MPRSRSRDRKNSKSDRKYSRDSYDYRDDSYDRTQKKKKSKRHREHKGSYRSDSRDSNYSGRKYESVNQGDELFDKLAREADETFNSKQEESNCLMVAPVPSSVSKNQLDDFFAAVAVQARAHPPDEIRFISAFKTAYVLYKSVWNARKILYYLGGKANFGGGNTISTVDFYQMNLAQPKNERGVVNLIQDWICDRCNYNNFAKRSKCNKCDNPKNTKCKVVFNSKAIVRHRHANQTAIRNKINEVIQQQQSKKDEGNSIMVTGEGLKTSTNSKLKEFFSNYSKIRSAKIIKHKDTEESYEVGILQFFSPEDAEYMLKIMSNSGMVYNEFPISGTMAKFTYDELQKLYDNQETPEPLQAQVQMKQPQVANQAVNQQSSNQQSSMEGLPTHSSQYTPDYQVQLAAHYCSPYRTHPQYQQYFKAYLLQVQTHVANLKQREAQIEAINKQNKLAQGGHILQPTTEDAHLEEDGTLIAQKMALEITEDVDAPQNMEIQGENINQKMAEEEIVPNQDINDPVLEEEVTNDPVVRKGSGTSIDDPVKQQIIEARAKKQKLREESKKLQNWEKENNKRQRKTSESMPDNIEQNSEDDSQPSSPKKHQIQFGLSSSTIITPNEEVKIKYYYCKTCCRKFKSESMLHVHYGASSLHKSNMLRNMEALQ